VSAGSLELLGLPVAPDRPGGEDVSLAPELDEIREARRGDDPGLAQGDWAQPPRRPQWPRVAALCERILRERSKDLQVAGYYAEALAANAGFPGLARGLATMAALLERFWDSCHPALAGAGEERAARLEWLNRHLVPAVRQIPLTTPESGGHGLVRWQQALAVANLGRRGAEHREEALRDGHLDPEALERAVAASGPGHFHRLLAEIREAEAAAADLAAVAAARFDQDPPSLEPLAAVLLDCRTKVEQALQRWPATGPMVTPAAAPAGPAAPPPGPAPGPSPAPAEAGPQTAPAGSAGAMSRPQAIRELRRLAAFFRATEPHSPVGPLAERAAAWAEMPLDQWLASVIKDPATLDQLRELLDLHP